MQHPTLIIFGGLPGTGKTTIARELSCKLDATYLRIDSIEQAMANSTLKICPTEDAGYMVGYAVAEDNLRDGRTVVADSVNSIKVTRAAWMNVATKVGCEGLEVEIICSNQTEHKKRIETRTADLPGHKLPNWQKVLDREYEEWRTSHVVIDTAGKSAHQCTEELLRFFSN